MSEFDELRKRIGLLEYHQRLLIQMINNPRSEFYKLVIEKGISEREVQVFLQLCDDLHIKLEEQKAEGFLYFHPLFNEFLNGLPEAFEVKEVVQACLKQELYEPLFKEFSKCIG
jgi:hypothetical protein